METIDDSKKNEELRNYFRLRNLLVEKLRSFACPVTVKLKLDLYFEEFEERLNPKDLIILEFVVYHSDKEIQYSNSIINNWTTISEFLELMLKLKNLPEDLLFDISSFVQKYEIFSSELFKKNKSDSFNNKKKKRNPIGGQTLRHELRSERLDYAAPIPKKPKLPITIKTERVAVHDGKGRWVYKPIDELEDEDLIRKAPNLSADDLEQ